MCTATAAECCRPEPGAACGAHLEHCPGPAERLLHRGEVPHTGLRGWWVENLPQASSCQLYITILVLVSLSLLLIVIKPIIPLRTVTISDLQWAAAVPTWRAAGQGHGPGAPGTGLVPGVPSLQGASGCPVLHEEAGVSTGWSSAGHGPPQCSHHNDDEQQNSGKYGLHTGHGLYFGAVS